MCNSYTFSIFYVLFVYIMFFKLVESYQKLIQPVPTKHVKMGEVVFISMKQAMLFVSVLTILLESSVKVSQLENLVISF